MRIAILGCGAMGSIYAGLLASDENEVICIDSNTEHVNAINQGGLRVSGASGDRTVTLNAYVNAPAETVDLLIVALKAAHIEAVASATEMLAEASIVLTIQNGLGSADIVADIVGPDRLIVGVAQGFGASLPEPGHSHHNDMKAIRMGVYQDASDSQLARVVGAFSSAGFDTAAESDIAVLQWEKLICNVAYSGPCALTGLTVGEVLDDPLIGPVSQAAAMEAFNIAKLKGVAINIEDPISYVKDFAARMRDAKPSVLLDIEAGRPSEIGVINGAVVSVAEQLGSQAPVNATITALVLSKEVLSKEVLSKKASSKSVRSKEAR